jgi:hypothetical protein
MFTGFDENDDPLFDSKESAIEYCRMKLAYSDPGTKIMVQRPRVPLWFSHLVRETPLQFLAYTEAK